MSSTIRGYLDSDLSGVIAVLRETMPQEAISDQRFVRQVLLDPNFRREGLAVAEADGEVAGCCMAMARQVPLENAPSDAERGYVTLLGVLPRHQRAGIGSRLLAHAEDYLRAQKRTTFMISSYAPGYFIPGIDVQHHPHALAFFQKYGYREVYRPLAMQTSLWDLQKPAWLNEVEATAADSGLGIEPYTPERTLPIHAFVAREFPGDWVRVCREVMHRIVEGDSPTRLLLALDREEIVGFSHFDRERFGPIGVASSQRGRKIGQMLMFKTLEAQRAMGFRAAWFMWSDDKTAARLYNGAGFKEVRRFVLLRKDLPAPQ
jgi:ribosomal protein S18 acetylase RimI-like enzyme